MTRARFGVQVLLVIALMVLVGLPNQRQLGAGSVWRANGPLVLDRAALAGAAAARAGGRGVYTIGYGAASTFAPGGGDALERRLSENALERRRRFVTPERVRALGGRYNAILGRAMSGSSAVIPGANLLLRNMVTGLVEARATAGENGEFLFLDVLPSGYVIELLGGDGAVMATSDLFAIQLGEVHETMVQAAGNTLAQFGGVLESTAAEAVQAAASQGVNRVTQPADTISPER